MTKYCQHVITESGALRTSNGSTGPGCETIELARQLPGNIRPEAERGERVAVVRCDSLPGYWTDREGHSHPRWDQPVIVEILEG